MKGKPTRTNTSQEVRLAVQGFAGIAVFMSFGLVLDALLGYKSPAYLNDPIRREMFRLAHVHGTLFGIVLVVAALTGRVYELEIPPAVRRTLTLGAWLMPAGFLLAGIRHPEGDPGLAIWLVPFGAILMLYGVIRLALQLRQL